VGAKPSQDLIDLAVRESEETKALLDRFKDYQRVDPLPRSAMHRRYAAGLEAAVKRLERAIKSSPSGMSPRTEMLMQKRDEQGSDRLRESTLSDLKRVEREMLSLQRIYESLHSQALDQQSAIETVGSNLISTENALEGAHTELLKTQEKKDRSLKWKIYLATFLTILIFIYLILS
jgi:t-SNARE complex subunit (syntaxin)